MAEPDRDTQVETRDGPSVEAGSGEVDETLVDLMLELTISDRLRALCRYVDALRRFRSV